MIHTYGAEMLSVVLHFMLQLNSVIVNKVRLIFHGHSLQRRIIAVKEAQVNNDTELPINQSDQSPAPPWSL